MVERDARAGGGVMACWCSSSRRPSDELVAAGADASRAALRRPVEARSSVGAGAAGARRRRARCTWPRASTAYAPRRLGDCVDELIERLSPTPSWPPAPTAATRCSRTSAARLDLPFAANCTAASGGDDGHARRAGAAACSRRRALHGRLPLLTVAPHAVPRSRAPARRRSRPSRPRSSRADLVVRVAEHVDDVDRRHLARRGQGRRQRRPRRRLGRGLRRSSRSSPACSTRAVGCSRVVTSAGWRPHTDQVGQTGTKISPDLYIACGISGATQHIAGCKGAKKILAINSDAEAPILASADYAVIGDLHEIVPGDHRRAAEGARVIAVAGRRARARGARSPSAATLFARRARLLVGLVRHGQAGRALRRRAAARRATRPTIVLGQRKLLQRLVPGPDARVHLLGLPRPVPDDRDRDDRRGRPRRDAALARPPGLVRAAGRRVRRARAGRRGRARSAIRKVAAAARASRAATWARPT